MNNNTKVNTHIKWRGLSLNRQQVYTARAGQIFESSRVSVFESPVYRIHNEYESRLGSDLQLPGSDRAIGSESLQCATKHMYSYEHKYTHTLIPKPHELMHTPTRARAHTHTLSHIHILIHNRIHKHTNTIIYTHTTHTNTYIHPYTFPHIHRIHTCIHSRTHSQMHMQITHTIMI